MMNAWTYSVTTSNNVILHVQHVIRDDFSNPSTKAKIDEFNRRLKERLDDRNFQIDLPGGLDSFKLPDFNLPEEIADRDERNIPSDEEHGDMLFNERPEDDDEDAIDKCVGMELIMDAGTDFERGARVVKRAKDDEGRPIGRAHSNPIVDSRSYEVEFADGTRDKVTANIVAENMYAQIDDHGNQYALLSEIQDHKKDGTALTEEDSWDYRGANKTRKPTTKGWQLLVAWKDGSSSVFPSQSFTSVTMQCRSRSSRSEDYGCWERRWRDESCRSVYQDFGSRPKKQVMWIFI